jgi:Ca2+-binding EF-hand superfamily protein
MERKGPRLYLLIFQIQLVFASAYISLLLLTFYPYFMKEETVTRLILYLGVSILPIYFLLKKFQMSAANMTTVSSIGVHRRPHAVAQVIREIKTEGIIRAMVAMQKLQHAAHTGWLAAPSTTEYNTHSVELIEVAKTFDALDKSGDGIIEIAELKNVMHALGAPTTEESLQAMMELLDRNQDGHISKDEFVAFYSTNVVLEVDNHHGLHDLAKHMFEQFDQDGSGEITMGEFKQVVDAFNVGFTIDEIGDLVNELDEQDNGTITEHEFLELLKKHKHLFQRIKLPALE